MLRPDIRFKTAVDTVDLEAKTVTAVSEDGKKVRGPISLRACYALPGTGLASAAYCLCACHAMSGTDVAYGATRRPSPTTS
eukprot:3795695-Rhodomonas_salina.1